MAGGSSPIQPPPAKRQKETSSAAVNSLGEDHPPAAMTGGLKRRRQRRQSKARRAPPLHKLGEDLLLEIFLRLPSLATLVRAALTCRAWRRAVASSPSFRRRFRVVHPPPLLGLFFEAPGPVQTPNTPAFPTFVPARRRDRDLTAAVRGGDFFLTSLEDLPDEGPCWYIVDRCRGRVLLVNWDDASLVVFNPLTRRIEDVFDLGPEDMFDDSRAIAPRSTLACCPLTRTLRHSEWCFLSMTNAGYGLPSFLRTHGNG
ncbi:hypothetical protein PAHAL_5G253400 [Panicum hallii]|jgi:hypothetical protein|uniref:F-box domain-containing protein n=1 Tax=Panicum hallii TaxID=206008 RepID=A0A2T8ILB9_9POAL|nr:hypothetical protein PAHAL_5G253400 [Panicum hallii]